MTNILLLLVISLLAYGIPSDGTQTYSILHWLDLLDATGYDRNVRPDVPALEVQVKLLVESIGNLQIKKMQFDADLYLQINYFDRRLSTDLLKDLFQRQIYVSKIAPFTEWQLINRIWRPDIYFANSNNVHFSNPQLILKDAYLGLWMSRRQIRTTVEMRLKGKFSCNMKLHDYPFDTQICYIKMLPYGHDRNEIQLIKYEDIEFLDYYKIVEGAWRLANYTMNSGELKYANKTYSCLQAEFTFERLRGQYIMQIYIPSATIVLVSWGSFWMDPNSVPGRVAVCITTLLTLATQQAGMLVHLPEVGYLKAVDIWMGVCVSFLFANLVEFAFVTNLTQRASHIRKKKTRKDQLAELRLTQNLPNLDSKPKPSESEHQDCDLSDSVTATESEDSLNQSQNAEPKVKSRLSKAERKTQEWYMRMAYRIDADSKTQEWYMRMAYRIDAVARIAFPILYVIFVIVYFAHFW